MAIHEANHRNNTDGDSINNNSKEFENERSTPPSLAHDDIKTDPSSPEIISSPVKNTGADAKGADFNLVVNF